MTAIVAIFSLLAAAVCLGVGLFSALTVRDKRHQVLDAIKPPPPAEDGSTSFAGEGLADTFEGVAKLAAALKDLDRIAQMFTLALGFTAVAALAVGVDAVAQAVK